MIAASQDDDMIAWYENLSLISNVLASEETAPADAGFMLASVYPNPFQTRASLAVTLPTSQEVRISVYDVQGRRRGVLFDGFMVRDQQYRLELDGNRLPAGIYFIRLEGQDIRATRKTVLVR